MLTALVTDDFLKKHDDRLNEQKTALANAQEEQAKWMRDAVQAQLDGTQEEYQRCMHEVRHWNQRVSALFSASVEEAGVIRELETIKHLKDPREEPKDKLESYWLEAGLSAYYMKEHYNEWVAVVLKSEAVYDHYWIVRDDKLLLVHQDYLRATLDSHQVFDD
jgi:hypothetical protein